MKCLDKRKVDDGENGFKNYWNLGKINEIANCMGTSIKIKEKLFGTGIFYIQ